MCTLRHPSQQQPQQPQQQQQQQQQQNSLKAKIKNNVKERKKGTESFSEFSLVSIVEKKLLTALRT